MNILLTHVENARNIFPMFFFAEETTLLETGQQMCYTFSEWYWKQILQSKE